MKRFITLLLAFVFLCGCAPALAEADVSVFDYILLYAKRYEHFIQTNKLSFNFDISNTSKAFPSSTGYVSVMTPAGDIVFDSQTFMVEEVAITLFDLNSEDDSADSMFMCMAAMSALEISAADESLLGMQSRFGLSDYSDAMAKILDLWQSSLNDKIAGAIRSKELSAGKDVLFYSGHYNYYLRWNQYGDTSYIMLVAKAKN